MKFYTYFLAFVLMGLHSCTFNSSRKSLEAGEQVSDEQLLSGITQVKVSGIINLYLSQGDKESIRIEGDEKAVELLTITENGAQIEIGYDSEDRVKNIFENFPPDVYLTLSDLNKLSFDGVGSIQTVQTIQVDELLILGNGIGKIALEVEAKTIDATFNMMGNITLSGRVETISLSNDGMGKIDASALIAQKMTLNSSGIGSVNIHCEEELSITLNGIGSVDYTGNPKVIKEEVNGIGKVSRN